jgi:short-subunit dehydrogenase involved in D-alanine esterification of teichoic acids
MVTGGTSGIGRQFAIWFAAEGAKVLACGRNDVALRKLQTEHPTIEAV